MLPTVLDQIIWSFMTVYNLVDSGSLHINIKFICNEDCYVNVYHCDEGDD